MSDNNVEVMCRVSAGHPDSGVSVDSDSATLTVNRVSAVITQHPQNRTITEGTNTTFSITATHPGNAELTYQWNHTLDSNVSGENTRTLSITNAAATDSGKQVTCTVTAYGDSSTDVTSNAGNLTVTPSSGELPNWHTPIPSQSKDDIYTISIALDDYCDNANSYFLSSGPGRIQNKNLIYDTSIEPGEYETDIIAINVGTASTTVDVVVEGTPPVITTQPGPMQSIVPNGSDNYCAATHLRNIDLFYQWEVLTGENQDDDDSWVEMHHHFSDVNRAWQQNVEITSTNQLDTELSPALGRCSVFAYERRHGPVAYSDTFSINIIESDVEITVHPENKTVVEPNGTTFYVEATEVSGMVLSYEWEAYDEVSGEWLDANRVLSDVDLDSVHTDTLIVNSTTLEESPGEEGIPRWETVTNVTIYEDQEDGYTRNMANFVDSLTPITEWHASEGTIDGDGVFTPPAGQGVGSNQYQIGATNAEGTAFSNTWTLTIRARGTRPEYDTSAMTFVGAFRGDNYGPNSDDKNQGTYRNIALNRTKDGLFVHGKNGTGRSQAIACVKIPETISPPGTAREDLVFANEWLQEWQPIWVKGKDVHPDNPENNEPTGPSNLNGWGPNLVGSCLHLEDDRLLVQGFIHYPNHSTVCQMYLLPDGSDIVNSDRRGFFTNEYARRGTTYFVEIPEDLRADFGGYRYGVGSATEIASRNATTSVGPSLGLIDPDQYTEERANAGDWEVDVHWVKRYDWVQDGAFNPWNASARLVHGVTWTPELPRDPFNATEQPNLWLQQNRALGGVFVPGTNTYLVFANVYGTTGARSAYKNTYYNTWKWSDHPDADDPDNPHPNAPEESIQWVVGPDYMPGSGGSYDLCRDWGDCRDPDDPLWINTGGYDLNDQTDGWNGIYKYDIQDLIAAFNGDKSIDDVMPYAVERFDVEYDTPRDGYTANPFHPIGGIAYDTENDLLYISLDTAAHNQDAPIYCVYKLNPATLR